MTNNAIAVVRSCKLPPIPRRTAQKGTGPSICKKRRSPSIRKYCPGKCGRESRRCNKCEGASGVSLCKHRREWFRARGTCCPKPQSEAKHVTIMPINKHTITKLTTPYQVGSQCTIHIVEHKNGKQFAKLSTDSSLQDLREILCIKNDVDLRSFAGVFDIDSLQQVLSKVV